MNLQLQIVEDLKLHDDENVKLTPHHIFSNYRSGRGLRLSKGGCQLMQKLYDSYEVKIKGLKPIRTKDVVLLEKHLTYPYFITEKKLILFSEKILSILNYTMAIFSLGVNLKGTMNDKFFTFI